IATKEYIIFNADKKRIISYHKTDDQLEIYNKEAEQENRRLLYVAITRAIYKCVIFYNNKPGTLNSFIENGLDTDWQHIKTMEYLQSKGDKDVEKWIPESSFHIDKKPLVFRGKIEDKWRLTSFSALDIHTHISKTETPKEEFENRYDAFVFRELSKGVQTGLILHSILEKINFKDKENHKLIIENTLKYYGRQYADSAIDNYLLLIENILETTLFPQKFKLKDIDNEKRFNELEFFYSFDNWQGQKIKEILPEIVISSREIEGVMHGFIDLLFVHQNKFYILDWKTNHLGNNSESYSSEKLKAAIEENNYFLQYYIYTIAAKRFLEKHIPDFDFNLNFGGVYYLFLRGMRMDKDTGIFFAKPQKDIIDRIENIIGT
ncbi:MAG TPA: hypothetical protein ENK91_16445, partial [Bacteroidetes bacterium]|nr:hypothetical protein [Bacteroidota bacterium]